MHDTGTGIPDAEREHIFEPFYTTKPAGKGTGLGLAVVRRVVDRAGGFVRLDSLGTGTTLRAVLPPRHRRIVMSCSRGL